MFKEGIAKQPQIAKTKCQRYFQHVNIHLLLPKYMVYVVHIQLTAAGLLSMTHYMLHARRPKNDTLRALILKVITDT